MSAEIARNILSSDPDQTAVLVACDALEESGQFDLSRAIRSYVEIQTNVRMSSERKQELRKIIADVNNTYALQYKDSRYEYWSKYIQRGCIYNNPVGPYYTGAHISFEGFIKNPDMLSVEPIRELMIYGCPSNDDFGMMLRNYRVTRLYSLQLRLLPRRNAIDYALQIRKNCNLPCVNEVVILGWGLNRTRLISSAILPKMKRGAKLTIDSELFTT